MRLVARCIFFATLAYAPLAYGGTTSTSIDIVNWLLATAFSLWVIELLVNRRWLKFPKLLLFLVVALLALGGWMVLNAFSIYDAAFESFAPLRNFTSRAAGSVDYAISTAWMIRGGLLLIAILFVVDLSQDKDGLLQLWYAVGIVAGLISLLGLLQKATGAEMIFWQKSPGEPVKTFFATYYYHANAGAYLNLVLPMTAGLAVRAFATPSRPVLRATWLMIFVLNLAAIAANTSRMAQLIGGLLVLGLAIQLGPSLIRRFSRAEINIALVGSVAILFALFAIGKASHLEEPLHRWQTLSEHISEDARWVVARVALGVLPHVGLFGFGPGTFRIVFPVFNSMATESAPGGWRFLHEDYLQTLIEWGWLGSALWALLFFGGIAVAVRNLRRHRREWTPRRRLILPLAALALGGVALHAIVDFPLQIMSIQLYAATYLGICWGSSLWGLGEK